MSTVSLTFEVYTGGIYSDADNYAFDSHYYGGPHFRYYEVYLDDDNEYDMHAYSFFETSIYVHSGTTDTSGLGLVYDQGNLESAFIDDWTPPTDGVYTIAVFHGAGYYYDWSYFSIYEELGAGIRSYGTSENDNIELDNYSNSIYCYSGNDTLFGFAGDDLVYGNQGQDWLSGGSGNDTIFGGQDFDFVYGGSGADVLYGNKDSDIVAGDTGNDTLYGGQGEDFLNGGEGNDVLFGNLGPDWFIVNATSGYDVVYGFNVSEDSLSPNGVSYSATTITDNGVKITWSDGGVIELIGVSADQYENISIV